MKQRDDTMPHSDEWAMEIALNSQKLQSNHTLVNALCRKLDEVIGSFLSHIIFRLDQNNNLCLIDPKNQQSPMSEFWLAVFSNPDLFPLTYSDMATSTLSKSSINKRHFSCQFPFSWEIIDHIEAIQNGVLSSTGKVKKHMPAYFVVTIILFLGDDTSVADLCVAIGKHPVQKLLSTVMTVNSMEFYRCYLHDFVYYLSLDIQQDVECDTAKVSNKFQLLITIIIDINFYDFCS